LEDAQIIPSCLQYFDHLFSSGKLDAFESLKMSRLAVSRNKQKLLGKWLAEDKLECTEELGDLVQVLFSYKIP